MLLSKSRVPRGRPRCGLDWAPRWYWRCRRRWCTLWLTSSCALDSTIATAVPAVSPSGYHSCQAVWLGSGLPQQSAPWSWSGRKCSLRGWAILVCFITIYSRISIFRISNIHTWLTKNISLWGSERLINVNMLYRLRCTFITESDA